MAQIAQHRTELIGRLGADPRGALQPATATPVASFRLAHRPAGADR